MFLMIYSTRHFKTMQNCIVIEILNTFVLRSSLKPA